MALGFMLAAGCEAGDDPVVRRDVGPYTRADVDAIVLGAADAPAGTAYVDAVSGFQDLQAFARDRAELGHLVEDGFEIGHLALFVPRGRVDGGAPEPLTNRSTIVQGITGLFHDAAGAERSLERYVADLRSRQLPSARVESAAGLGDVSFGLRGKTPDGARVQMYVWRIGNLVLAISGSGPMEPAEIRALADLLDGRTSVGSAA